VSNDQIARELLVGSIEYHELLIKLARGISRFQELMRFIVDCMDFGVQNIPNEVYTQWIDSNQHIPKISENLDPLVSFSCNDPLTNLGHLINTSASGTTDSFSFLLNNYNFYENTETREEFKKLSLRFGGLLARPEDISYAHSFVTSVYPTAGEKFIHSLDAMDSLPESEDPQGCLLEMRSAIDLTIKRVIDLIGLTKKEGKLKIVQQLPTIARYLAKDDQSRVILILANSQFVDHKSKLAASKDIKYSKDQARSLMDQSIAFLNQIASAIDIPNEDNDNIEG